MYKYVCGILIKTEHGCLCYMWRADRHLAVGTLKNERKLPPPPPRLLIYDVHFIFD